MSHPAFTAIYVPLVLFSAWSAWLYGRHVLWPALQSRSLTVKSHGMPLGMVCWATADAYESARFGIGRLNEALYWAIAWDLPQISLAKLLIIAGSMFMISSYWHAVYGKGVMLGLLVAAVALWAVSYLALSAFA